MLPAETSNISIWASVASVLPEAKALAEQLNLALLAPNATPAKDSVLLILSPERLALQQYGPNTPGPVYPQWDSGRLAYRQRNTYIRREAIARAVGLKHNLRPSVLDATAGLGRDGFMLAALGCQVRLLERSPIIAALLSDALKRATAEPELMPWVNERLSLLCQESSDYLSQLTDHQRPDVVYLDPMYPHRRKTAQVKKESRMLRAVVGDDVDADALLPLALTAARQRVVVKRPLIAPVLQGDTPDFAIKGKSTRFDVYCV
jgi:16S rRNA (guanine1516-N2)-methyltransferase